MWIEGADDLTQEAQAFLRRILETAATNVTCALEVREIWKLSPPILSRCTVVTMRSEQSHRGLRNKSIGNHIGLSVAKPNGGELPVWSDIPRLRMEGQDSYEIIEKILEVHGLANRLVQEFLRAIESVYFPWI